MRFKCLNYEEQKYKNIEKMQENDFIVIQLLTHWFYCHSITHSLCYIIHDLIFVYTIFFNGKSQFINFILIKGVCYVGFDIVDLPNDNITWSMTLSKNKHHQVLLIEYNYLIVYKCTTVVLKGKYEYFVYFFANITKNTQDVVKFVIKK